MQSHLNYPAPSCTAQAYAHYLIKLIGVGSVSRLGNGVASGAGSRLTSSFGPFVAMTKGQTQSQLI